MISEAALNMLFEKLDKLTEGDVLILSGSIPATLPSDIYQRILARLGVPKGKVKNSVGAGDSMVAGFLAGWFKTKDYGQAHRMGAAAGSATVFSDDLATEAEVLALLETNF